MENLPAVIPATSARALTHAVGARAWESLLLRLNTDPTFAKYVPQRDFAPPRLPPGVLPANAANPLAMDSANNMYGWLNAGGGGADWCGMGFPGYPLLANLTQRSEYRAPTETIAGEMTRAWLQFTGASDKEQEQLEEAFEEFAVRDCVRACTTHDGFFGRGQLYIQIKGQDGDRRRALPLNIDDNGATIKKGDLLGFKPIEPIWTTPYSYNSIDPTREDFYKPDAWYVIGKRTHASRLLTFISRPVPDILKPSYNFSGLSLSQLIEPYVARWLKTVDSVNRLISNFSIISLKTDLMASLQDPATMTGETGLFARLAVFNKMRDNRGIFAIDKNVEELESIAVPLAGLAELQAQAQEHMAAPTHIPLVKLTGITPSGLNASSDGEIKVFYDFIASEQKNDLTPHVTTILKIIQLHLWGKVNPKIGFEWVKLDSPTDKEQSDMRKADGERDARYVEIGAVSNEEVRERLRKDPNSGYTFISGPAPTPPALAEQELAHELGQEGAELDAGRAEEGAESGAEREAKAREHQAKLDKDKPKVGK